ncbi:MAG: M20/M25/M40 family metallo-hydrolase, partial [Betaproteobacteria bacterium]
MIENVIDFINVNRERYLDELKKLLAIPSISALPEHAGDVKKCAEWCADEMRRIGLQNVRLIATPGNPVVYGDWTGAPGAPTILFYGHYDVQPVDPIDLWKSPPFEPEVRDAELYARGAVDDKGQIYMHWAAVEAHMKANGRLPVNLKMLFEGEEEIGSDHLDRFLSE